MTNIYIKANIIKEKTKKIISSFIKDEKGSDDKKSGSAMSIIYEFVIGLLILGFFYAFFNEDFLPTVGSKIMEAINYHN